jgi:hypothetical protein
MEYWGKTKILKPNIPLFHHSSIPISLLCVLCLLFVHPLAFNPQGSKGKEESISIK